VPSLLPPDSIVRVLVFGPAYLDHVVRVRGPLCGRDWPEAGAAPVPLDYSRTEAGRSVSNEPGTFLRIESPGGDVIRVTGGKEPGAVLRVAEDRICDEDAVRRVTGCGRVPPVLSTVALADEWGQLGGMGTGFALALDGRLVAPVGASDDTGERVGELLTENRVSHALVPVRGAQTDTTTLILSDAGDKLPIGRRDAILKVGASELLAAASEAEVVIMTASLPSAVVAELASRTSGWKLFAPSLRSIREGGIEEIAAHVDAMSMNETEWAGIGDQREVLAHCSLVAVTHGGRGVSMHFRGAQGRTETARVPAAPPPAIVDINRAGEAFTAGLIGALLAEAGLGAMRCGHYREDVVREAAWEGAIAAALELVIEETRFPSREEVLMCRLQLGGPPAADSR
jgi:sugar/nucleoside kinase (ribokinase family)